MAKSGVSLTAPRPIGQRAANEYIETPLPRLHQPHPTQRLRQQHLPLQEEGGEGRHSRHHLPDNNNKKDVLVPVHRTQPSKPAPPLLQQDNSIICSECGRCRCESCRNPAEPPSAWLCRDLCYCSPESCVDYASCLCCVKGIMYHCSTEGQAYSRDPCSCSSAGWLPRWACLGFTALFFPCLCCYCPLKACSDSCTSAYVACSRRGCSCDAA
ncbi:protein sprouty homolog 3 [Cimex lectularius]|uniref:Sprouty n=1 Tax=Cimex lectularius TaxID=79782 RepID=A0A8I6SED6_CIMLE|nr:protein sprouty homolog 3 [Cimex lectularius]XP_014259257.1 protein sprouty homolog 3 [Cimex lectularius]XP_024083942.1 protein sprouty homolog 3 [Cimex lectularius]